MRMHDEDEDEQQPIALRARAASYSALPTDFWSDEENSTGSSPLNMRSHSFGKHRIEPREGTPGHCSAPLRRPSF